MEAPISDQDKAVLNQLGGDMTEPALQADYNECRAIWRNGVSGFPGPLPPATILEIVRRQKERARAEAPADKVNDRMAKARAARAAKREKTNGTAV